MYWRTSLRGASAGNWDMEEEPSGRRNFSLDILLLSNEHDLSCCSFIYTDLFFQELSKLYKVNFCKHIKYLAVKHKLLYKL